MHISGRSLRALVEGLRRGTPHPRELREHCDAAHDPELGAYRLRTPDLAARQSDAAAAALACGADPGALCGVPVSIKDIYGVTGLDTYAGTPRPLPEVWCLDGGLVTAVRAQLGVIVGKTHSVEFAFGGLGTNAHWPTPVNPWRHEDRRVPGGSSSGAGVSVSEGSALVALGTDTAGSVRVPASMTGVAGFKPSRGVWATDGIVPLSPSLDTPGILARSADDLAVVYAALVRDGDVEPLAAHTLDLALPRELVWDDCDPGVSEAVTQGLMRIRQAGGRCRDLDIPELPAAVEIFRAGSLAAPELDHFLNTSLPEWREKLDPNVATRVDANRKLLAREYIDRRQRLAALTAAVKPRLGLGTLLALPTVAITPPRQADVSEPQAYAAHNVLALRNTAPANLLNFCAVTIPCGTDNAGMPVGLQLLARQGEEKILLGAAVTIENVLASSL